MVLGLFDEKNKVTEKLKITPVDSDYDPFYVLFNPNSYSISKTVNWDSANNSSESPNSTNSDRRTNAPALRFDGGESRQLTLELFYDVTENDDVKDVRMETNKIVSLTRIERDMGRPPVCRVSWGNDETGRNSDFPFTGVVTSLNQNFTLFTFDGKPVRATLTVIFREYLDPETDKRETDPENSTWIIKRGDRLSYIAATVYKDPSLWRLIAEENELDDPRRLEVGRKLSIPKLS